MWGKLTERNNRTKSKIISDPHEIYNFLATPGIEVANLMFASDDSRLGIIAFHGGGSDPQLTSFQRIIGAYITAGARLHLYSYLD